jgi:hypothetical protein
MKMCANWLILQDPYGYSLSLDLIPEKFTLNPNDSNHYKITLKMDLNELKIFIEF